VMDRVHPTLITTDEGERRSAWARERGRARVL